MNDDQFRAVRHEALDAVGLLPFPSRYAETVDLKQIRLTRSFQLRAEQLKPAEHRRGTG